MKKLALTLALLMLFSMLAACGPADDGADTNADTENAGTDAPETNAPETEAPETDAPETDEIIVEPEIELPTQGEVPCDFDNVFDLTGEILIADCMLTSGAAEWVIGGDTTPISTPITEDMLKEYKYFAFKYECEYCEPTNEIGLVFKFVHEDGTKTEFLCANWFQYGPAGMTYMSSEFYKDNVYGPTGVIYVPTELFLNHEAYVSGDVIDQVGISAIEDTNTTVFITVTGAYLTK